jgi:hypothetical protein
MFYERYIEKTDEELIEMLNSNSYQLEAKETAEKILEERGITNCIKDETPVLNDLGLIQLLNKLKEYTSNLVFNRRGNSIELSQTNNGLFFGITLLIIGSILTFILFLFYFEVNVGSYIRAKAHGQLVLFTSFPIILLGFKLYSDSRSTKLRFLSKNKSVVIKQQFRWKKKEITISLHDIKFDFEKEKRKCFILAEVKNKKLKLFEFKDQKMGSQTEDFLSILIDKLNKQQLT